MNKRQIHNLIYFVNHNKTLTRAQILKRDELLTRDCYVEKKQGSGALRESDSGNNMRCHRPKELARFLAKFSGDNKLKFTTHVWDRSEISDFDDFVKLYSDLLRQDPLWKDLYNCNPQVYWLIRNYLLDDGTSAGNTNRFWSTKYRIKVGLQNPKGLISGWLRQNPGKQMFDMPLSEYKDGYMENGVRIRGNIPVYFNEIAELFKHCIEFRDADFYNMIRRVFCNSDFEIDKASLKSLRGVTFFTATELVEEALEGIANNIRSRKDNSVQVEIWREKSDGWSELHILHTGSFALSDINSDKLMLRNANSQFSTIKRKLQSLCDFYIVSRFIVDGEEKDARIDYLKGEDAGAQPEIIYLEKGTSRGFECVLKFYH